MKFLLSTGVGIVVTFASIAVWSHFFGVVVVTIVSIAVGCFAFYTASQVLKGGMYK